MDHLPSNTFDDGVRFPSLEEDIPLSDSAVRARRALARQNKDAKPPRFRRESVLEAYYATFLAIGGEPRMYEWADQNYTEFMKLFGKTLTPAINQMSVNASGPVQIVTSIQRSALDDSPELAPDGLALPPPSPPLKDETV